MLVWSGCYSGPPKRLARAKRSFTPGRAARIAPQTSAGGCRRAQQPAIDVIWLLLIARRCEPLTFG